MTNENIIDYNCDNNGNDACICFYRPNICYRFNKKTY